MYAFAKAGTFTETLALPARLAPRAYVLHVNGSAGGRALPEVDSSFTVPTPPEGVVDSAAISSTRGGKSVHVVPGAHELWARFHFLVPPDAKTVKVVWRTPSYTFVGAATKPYTSTIDSFVSSTAPLPKGTWYAILTVNSKIAKRVDVRVT